MKKVIPTLAVLLILVVASLSCTPDLDDPTEAADFAETQILTEEMEEEEWKLQESVRLTVREIEAETGREVSEWEREDIEKTLRAELAQARQAVEGGELYWGTQPVDEEYWGTEPTDEE